MTQRKDKKQVSGKTGELGNHFRDVRKMVARKQQQPTDKRLSGGRKLAGGIELLQNLQPVREAGTESGFGKVSISLPPGYRSIMTPPAELTVSEWCDENRILSKEFTAEAGPWQTSRVPYLREIMDSFADPTVGLITLIKCSRVGGTELLNNVLAWTAQNRPMPVVYVLPREPDVAEEFKGRIKHIFMDSPVLRKHIPTSGQDGGGGAGGEWCTSDPPTITLDNLRVYGAWASSPGTLTRRTAGILIFDELDNCDSAYGKLGNTLKLGQDRLTTYGYRAKGVSATTPTTANASGWKALQESDYRKYYVPCPRCGHYQVLIFAGIQIPETERDPDQIEGDKLAWYQCEHCRGRIGEKELYWMLERGIWVPRTQQVAEKLDVSSPDQIAAAKLGNQTSLNPWATSDVLYGLDLRRFGWRPALTGEAPKTRHRGYWLNSCYSPWRSWSQIMGKFLRCRTDPEELRVFWNSWMAQPYEERTETAKVEVLEARVPEGLPRDVVPREAKLLLVGADVQDNYIPYVVRAWGPGEQSWKIRHGRAESFEELYDLVVRQGFPIGGNDSGCGRMIARAIAIDTGHRTDEVYEFAQSHEGVIPVKGRETMDERWKPSQIEKFSKVYARTFALTLFLVNTNLFKSKAHRMAMGDKWHLDQETDREYLNQFTAENLVWIKSRRNGRMRRHQVWAPRTEGTPNHYLDCEVYALAAADMLNVPLIREEATPQGVLVPVVVPGNVSPPMAEQPRSQNAKPVSKYGWVRKTEE